MSDIHELPASPAEVLLACGTAHAERGDHRAAIPFFVAALDLCTPGVDDATIATTTLRLDGAYRHSTDRRSRSLGTR
jgi:hypothetical protein